MTRLQLLTCLFTPNLIQEMTANTDFYDVKKKAGIEGRDWKPVIGAELRSWIGILIYMGVCRMPAMEGYSKHDGFYPTNMSIFHAVHPDASKKIVNVEGVFGTRGLIQFLISY